MLIPLKQKFFRNALGALIAILTLAIVSSAQETGKQDVKTPEVKTAEVRTTVQPIRIKNFGQMDGRFYRGAQPRDNDYKDLAALGVTTVIDLRDDPQQGVQSLVESLGMRYVHIPMVAKKYPTPEVTETFLKTVNDPATGKFFVHCAGGRHRTGAMGAVYRYQFYNWNFDQVYKEMKQYDFYTSWGHGAFKDFVRDYYARTQANKATNPESAPVKGQDKQ